MLKFEGFSISPILVLVLCFFVISSNYFPQLGRKTINLEEIVLKSIDTRKIISGNISENEKIIKEVDASLKNIKGDIQIAKNIPLLSQGEERPLEVMLAQQERLNNAIRASGETIDQVVKEVESKVEKIKTNNEQASNAIQNKINELEKNVAELQNELDKNEKSTIPLWSLFVAILAMLPSWIQLFILKRENKAITNQ